MLARKSCEQAPKTISINLSWDCALSLELVHADQPGNNSLQVIILFFSGTTLTPYELSPFPAMAGVKVGVPPFHRCTWGNKDGWTLVLHRHLMGISTQKSVKMTRHPPNHCPQVFSQMEGCTYYVVAAAQVVASLHFAQFHKPTTTPTHSATTDALRSLGNTCVRTSVCFLSTPVVVVNSVTPMCPKDQHVWQRTSSP